MQQPSACAAARGSACYRRRHRCHGPRRARRVRPGNDLSLHPPGHTQQVRAASKGIVNRAPAGGPRLLLLRARSALPAVNQACGTLDCWLDCWLDPCMCCLQSSSQGPACAPWATCQQSSRLPLPSRCGQVAPGQPSARLSLCRHPRLHLHCKQLAKEGGGVQPNDRTLTEVS